jgi:hypothetical protein
MRQLRTFEYIAEEEPAARRVHVRKKTVPELAYTLAERRATRQLSLGKIDSRLGGPRTDAKAAPEEEPSHRAKDSVAVARSGSG